MNRLFQLVGLITSILLLGLACNWTYQNFTNIVEKVLMGFGVLALIALIVRVIYGKMWLLNLGKEFFVGNDLIDATENFLNDLPNPKNESTANLVGHLVYRFTRLGVIGLVLAIIPTWLLFNQNELIGVQTGVINKQTKLLEKQTKRLDHQTYLQEAERVKPTNEEFNSILKLINNVYLKSDTISPKFISNLGSQLVNLDAYRYLSGDTLNKKAYSPEKSKILKQLFIKLEVHDWKILKKVIDFQECDIANTNFPDDVDFSNINMNGSRFKRVSMRFSNFNNTKLNGCDFIDCSFWNSKFTNSLIPNSSFHGTRLDDADFSKSILMNSNFEDAELYSTVFDSTNLSRCDFRNADIYLSSFKGANLKDAKVMESQRFILEDCGLTKNQLSQIKWFADEIDFK